MMIYHDYIWYSIPMELMIPNGSRTFHDYYAFVFYLFSLVTEHLIQIIKPGVFL